MPADSLRTTTTPRWMRGWLIGAGAYNIVWGSAMALAPVWTLGLLGAAPQSRELWPQLWACIGMIVGVYGLGYLLAARDPARHWPIVLVGLIGKILGPIGFVDAAARGLLPWSMGVTILTNDLLWWIPFAMILWHAARVAQPAPPEGAVPLDAALDALRDEQGRTLRAHTNDRPTLVVLLRHSGCTFCKQTLADLARWHADIEKAGIGLAVVGMAPSSDDLRAVGLRHGLTSAAWFADPDRLLYRALELGRGSFLQLFGPRVWLAGVLAALRGHGVGRLEGDGFQMPGAFVIHRGQVVRSYRHATAGDRPDLKEFACPVG
ncbi:MAG: peroxiredoxin-like family protein [Planctomycetota bacterium]|nr:peroxiredoxin-like family protein [Planctomycetota bacterium]